MTGDNSTLCAVLGESLKSETVTMNGTSYIWIGDMYIPVVGVLKIIMLQKKMILSCYSGTDSLPEFKIFPERIRKYHE